MSAVHTSGNEIACEIVTVSPRKTIAASAEVAFAEIPAVQRALREKIDAAMREQGISAAGPCCTLTRLAPKGLYMEPATIVDGEVARADQVFGSELPGGRVIRHTLLGPYDQLPQIYPRIIAWAQKHGHALEGTFWEIYDKVDADPAKNESTIFALLA